MRRGSAARVRSRQTRMQAPGDAGRTAAWNTICAPPAPRTDQRDSSEPRSAWKDSASTMSAKPPGPPRRPARRDDCRDRRCAATSATPRPRARATHSGTSASGASFTHPAAASAAVEPSCQRERDQRRGHHVVRAARGGDHHRREGEERDALGRRAARRAARRRQAPPREQRERGRDVQRALEPVEAVVHRAITCTPAHTRDRRATDRCRRGPALSAKVAVRQRAVEHLRGSGQRGDTRRRSPDRRGSTEHSRASGRRANAQPPHAARRSVEYECRGRLAQDGLPPPTRSAREIGEQHGCGEHAPLQVTARSAGRPATTNAASAAASRFSIRPKGRRRVARANRNTRARPARVGSAPPRCRCARRPAS